MENTVGENAMNYTVGQITALASGKIDEMWRQIMTSTVPFLRFKHGRLEHEASGVLMRIADSEFVLTASHALKQLLDGEISMLLMRVRRIPLGFLSQVYVC